MHFRIFWALQDSYSPKVITADHAAYLKRFSVTSLVLNTELLSLCLLMETLLDSLVVSVALGVAVASPQRK